MKLGLNLEGIKTFIWLFKQLIFVKIIKLYRKYKEEKILL